MIYLDHAATTPCAPEVIDAMLPYFGDIYANASSEHNAGLEVMEAVEKGRRQVAELIGVSPEEIFFTSGATESINWAADIFIGHSSYEPLKMYLSAIEHKAVLEAFGQRCRHHNRVPKYISSNPSGQMSMDLLRQYKGEIKEVRSLVACMWINNETGVVQPIKEIAQFKRENDFVFFCDATQAVGKVPVRPKEYGIDLMAFSSHKMYGPKGMGALYVNKDRYNVHELPPLIFGGSQQHGRRGGTLNVPGIVGFGKAAELASVYLGSPEDQVVFEQKVMLLQCALVQNLSGVVQNGDQWPLENQTGILNFSFEGVESEGLMAYISDKVAFSRGSACNALDWQPSYVLEAMSLPEERSRSACRFSLGRHTTVADLQQAAGYIIEGVQQLRTD